MKSILIILPILLSTSTVFSQNKWEKIESTVYKQFLNKEITGEEWMKKRREDAGSIGRSFSAWYKTTDTLKTKSENNAIKLYFPEDLMITRSNGGIYMQMYLENHSEKEFIIQRIDATIGKMTEYFFIDNKWIKGRSNSMSSCGNSYFDVKLGAKQRIYFHLGNALMKKENNNVKYKVAIELKATNGNPGAFIESNVIEVSLLDNQRKRLVESQSEQKLHLTPCKNNCL